MTGVVITQPMLFPWPGFFEQLMLADRYVYLDDAQFSKGSFTNRVKIVGPRDLSWMTIPLAGKGTFQRIADLEGAGTDWRREHRAKLVQSLAGAVYRDDAIAVFDRAYGRESILELLIESIEGPARYLGLGSGRETTRASALGTGGASWRRVLQTVLDVGGTEYITGHGAAEYLDHEAFEAAGVTVRYVDYSKTPWFQPTPAPSPFVSILDLIGRHGPGARAFLAPNTVDWRAFMKSRSEGLMTDQDYLSVQADMAEKGYALLRGFYDPERLVQPIQEGIRQIVELICAKYGVAADTRTPLSAMTIAYPLLIAKNRAAGGEVYDAVKQIPALVRLVSDAGNDAVFQALRPGSRPGIAAGGYGIRIDNPSEEKFRALWHQEFPAQLRSLDGVVFWTPLVPITPELGPVEIAEGSHAEGLVPVYSDDAGADRTGAYALHLDREAERLARYNRVAPLTEPGDLILMDFLTLHQSGVNRSSMPRWSIQFRYFNFAEPLGVRIGWRGSFAAGVDFAEVLPELVAQSGAAQ